MIREVAAEFKMNYRWPSERAVKALMHLTYGATKVEGGKYPRKIVGKGYIVECEYDDRSDALSCRAYANEEGARKLIIALFDSPHTYYDSSAYSRLSVEEEGSNDVTWRCKAFPPVLEAVARPGIEVKSLIARAEGDFVIRKTLELLINFYGNFPVLKRDADGFVAVMGNRALPCLVKVGRHEAEVKCQADMADMADLLDEPKPVPFFTRYETDCSIAFSNLEDFLEGMDRAEELVSESFAEVLSKCDFISKDPDFRDRMVFIYASGCPPEPIKWYPFILR